MYTESKPDLRKYMIIAVDGPSGAGKGTLAHRIAAHYGFALLDTGLLYRATAWKAQKAGIDLADGAAVTEVARALGKSDIKNEAVLRSEKLGQAASVIAVYPEVRQILVTFMKDFAHQYGREGRGAVLDGRDIGTVVCPEADLKFYITATPEERAIRRVKELQSRSIPCIYEEILQEMLQRDARDQNRKEGPLRQAEDAIVIDTTHQTPAEVVAMAFDHIDGSLGFSLPPQGGKN
jgi:cytidylate kinase